VPRFWNHTKEVDKRSNNGDVSEGTSAGWSVVAYTIRGFEHMAFEGRLRECAPWWIPL
jgi:hypothetical protein